MRVALVCPYSLSLPGGVQGQVLGLARELRLLGHQVRVLGPSDGPPPEAGITTLGRCVPTAINGSVAPIAPGPACAVRTLRVLRDNDFDVLHLHEPLSPGPTLTSLVLGSDPIVGTFHAAGGKGAYRFLRPLARWLSQRLSVRVAVSDDARSMAVANIGGAYEVLHNGIEIEAVASAVPWPTEGPTIFFCSRHESRKGLAVLVEAMSRLGPDVRLWVASDGPETEHLMAATAGDTRISWLGRIDDGEKLRRLRGAQVMCAPSLHGESFGMVLLEAMAASVPVVASDIPGYRATSDGGRCALLVTPGDAAALAGELSRVLNDEALAATLVAAGIERAEDFSMHRLAKSYSALYQVAVDNFIETHAGSSLKPNRHLVGGGIRLARGLSYLSSARRKS